MASVKLPMIGEQSATFTGASINGRTGEITLNFNVTGFGVIPVVLDRTDAKIIHEKLGKGLASMA